jgi:hypothetical protein
MEAGSFCRPAVGDRVAPPGDSECPASSRERKLEFVYRKCGQGTLLQRMEA